ncbi:hypothetical protein ACGFZB_06510 [Streptomyces cinerochromogenes]|uniref:Uncharacterized protein n=1 Tax=Streptomyces cinerochromogenes TaxID=66422 RepID=A0ABW7AYY1_9ACTN
MTQPHVDQAMCVSSGEMPLTVPEVTIVVVVLVLAVVLALAGMPTLSVLVLLAESTDTAIRLIRRLRVSQRLTARRG